MRKFVWVIGLMLFAFQYGHSQQDPMFTKYAFVPLAYNPAYAGSKDYASLNAIYRNQWWGINGGPSTQVLTAHTPVSTNIGVGLSLFNDNVGARSNTGGGFSYAYKVKANEFNLSFGIQASLISARNDWGMLNHRDDQANDVAFSNNQSSIWLPNFGAGFFGHTERFFFGLSIPNLIEQNLREKTSGEAMSAPLSQQYRHLFIMTGAAFKINSDMVFRPIVLVKNVGWLGGSLPDNSAVSAPTEIDLDVSILYREFLWVGVSFRTAAERIFSGDSSTDSFDIWATFMMDNGLSIGAAYDYTLNDLQSHIGGTMELMVGYDLNFKKKKYHTPRYF